MVSRALVLCIQIDTPGFGDVVDNTNCWQPISGDLKIQNKMVDKRWLVNCRWLENSQKKLVKPAFTFYAYLPAMCVWDLTSKLIRVSCRAIDNMLRLPGGSVLSVPGRWNKVTNFQNINQSSTSNVSSDSDSRPFNLTYWMKGQVDWWTGHIHICQLSYLTCTVLG